MQDIRDDLLAIVRTPLSQYNGRGDDIPLASTPLRQLHALVKSMSGSKEAEVYLHKLEDALKSTVYMISSGHPFLLSRR
jgi:hypothetical protein